MEENQSQESSLFGLTIDSTAKSHLNEAAGWARFISIAAFIIIGLYVLMLVISGGYTYTVFNRGGYRSDDFSSAAGAGATLIIVMIVLVFVLVGLAYLFLYRFASNMKNALRTNSQELLNRSFQNLKILYRYLGILTIIWLAFVLLGLLSSLLMTSRI